MSGNNEELPEDPFGKRGEQFAGFEGSQRRDRTAAQIRQRAQERFPFLDETDIQARQTEEGTVAEFTPEARREIERRLAAEEFDAELDKFDVGPGDVERTDEGLQLAEGVRRKVAARQFDSEIGDTEITPEDLELTDKGFQLGDAASKAIAAKRIDAELPDLSIGPGDLTQTEDGFAIRDEKRKKIAAEKLDERIETKLDIRPNHLKQSEEGGFRIDKDIQEFIVQSKIQSRTGVELSVTDIEPADDGGFKVVGDKRKELAAAGFDEEFPGLTIDPNDLTRTDDGFGLIKGVQKEIAAQRIDEQIDIADVGSDDLVSFQNDEGQRSFRPTETFQRELVRARLVQEDNDIGPGDIREIRELTPAEQVEAAIGESDLLDPDNIDQERRQELIALAEQDALGDELQLSEIPEFRPVFSDDFTKEQVREQLVSENDDIDEDDIVDVVELAPQEQVELVMERAGLKSPFGTLPEERRQELLDLAESDQLDQEFADVDVPEFKPVFADEFQQSKAIEQLVSENDNIDREDIAGIEQTDEGEFRPEFTQSFRREQFREAVVEQSEDLTKDDIAGVEQLTPEEQVEAFIQQSDQFKGGLDVLPEQRADQLLTLAKEDQLDEEFEDASVPEFRPVLSLDAREERFRETLTSQEGISPEDVAAIERRSAEEQVEAFIERSDELKGGLDAIPDKRRQQLLGLARKNKLNAETDVNVAAFEPEFTQEFQKQRFEQAVIEQSDDLTKKDVTGVRELSPTEQVSALLGEGDVDLQTVQERQEDIQDLEAAFEGGKLSATEAQERLAELGFEETPTFAPELSQGERAQRTAEALDQRFPDRDIGVGDIQPVEDGQGFQLEKGLRWEIAADKLDAQIDDRDIGPSDLIATEDGFRVRSSRTSPAQVLRRSAQQNPEAFLAAVLDQQLDEADINPGDVDIPDGADTRLGNIGNVDFALDAEVQRELAAAQFDAQIQDREIAREDVTIGDDGARLGSEVQQEITADRLDEQVGVDITTDDLERTDVNLRESIQSGGIGEMVDTTELQLTEGAQERIAAGRFDEQLEADIDQSDVTTVGDGPALDRAATARLIDEQTPGVNVRETDLQQRAGGFELTQSRRELVARELDQRFSGDSLTARRLGAGDRPVDADIDASDLERSDVNLREAVQSGGAGEIQDTTRLQLNTDTQEAIAAARLDRQLGIDVTSSDVSASPQGFELGDEARTALQDQARERVASRVSDELGRDVSADDIVIDEQTGGVSLSRDVREDVAFEQIQGQTEVNIDRSDVRFGEEVRSGRLGAGRISPQLTASLSEEARQAEREALDAGDETASNVEGREQVIGSTVPVAPGQRDIGSANVGGPIVSAAAGLESTIADLPGVGTTADIIRSGASLTAGGLGGAREAISPVTSPIVSGSEAARDFTVNRLVNPAADAFSGPLGLPGVNVTGPGVGNIKSFRESAIRSGGKVVTDLTVGLPSTISTGIDTAASAGQFVGEEISERGVVGGTGEIVDASLDFAQTTGRAAAIQAQRNPFEFTGRVAGELVGTVGLSIGAGRALGKGARLGRDRLRTLAAKDIDAEALTDAKILRQFEQGDIDFPGPINQQRFIDRPAAQVRRQAQIRTPDAIKAQFERAGVSEGVPLKKTLELEPDPEGVVPGIRSARNFQTEAGDFESPGAFVSSDLSPNFLRIQSQDPEFSFRPGLPSLGGSPTGVIAKTDVEAPDADTLQQFNRELLEQRRGDTTAITKPRSALKQGEIEAVVPPEARFVDVNTGPLRDTLRRFGIGADFATEVAGRRVPLRTVAPESEVSQPGSASIRSLLRDERAAAGARPPRSRVSRRFDERRSATRPVDRPLPVAPARSRKTDVDSEIDSSGPIARNISDSAARTRGVESRRSVRTSLGDDLVPTVADTGERSDGSDSDRQAIGGPAAPLLESDVRDRTTAADDIGRSLAAVSSRAQATPGDGPVSSPAADEQGIGGPAAPPAFREDRDRGLVDRPLTGTPAHSSAPSSPAESSPSPALSPSISAPSVEQSSPGFGEGAGFSSPSSPSVSEPSTTTSSVTVTSPAVSLPGVSPSIPLPAGASGSKRPVRFDSEDDSTTFDLAFDSETSKQFTGGVATPSSVLTAEGPADTQFSADSVTVIDDDPRRELVSAEGDIPGDIEEEIQ